MISESVGDFAPVYIRKCGKFILTSCYWYLKSIIRLNFIMTDWCRIIIAITSARLFLYRLFISEPFVYIHQDLVTVVILSTQMLKVNFAFSLSHNIRRNTTSSPFAIGIKRVRNEENVSFLKTGVESRLQNLARWWVLKTTLCIMHSPYFLNLSSKLMLSCSGLNQYYNWVIMIAQL